MPTHTITVNNNDVELAVPPNDTVVPAKRILQQTGWHYESYQLHEDEYAAADDAPADFDKRAGDVMDAVDIANVSRVIARHKFR